MKTLSITTFLLILSFPAMPTARFALAQGAPLPTLNQQFNEQGLPSLNQQQYDYLLNIDGVTNSPVNDIPRGLESVTNSRNSSNPREFKNYHQFKNNLINIDIPIGLDLSDPNAIAFREDHIKPDNIFVSKSNILQKKDIEKVIEKYLYKQLKSSDILKIANQLNALYQEKGYLVFIDVPLTETRQIKSENQNIFFDLREDYTVKTQFEGSSIPEAEYKKISLSSPINLNQFKSSLITVGNALNLNLNAEIYDLYPKSNEVVIKFVASPKQ